MQKKKKGKKAITILFVVAVMVILCSVVHSHIKKGAEEAMNEAAGAESGEVTTRELIKSVGATGTIVSKKSRNLTTSLTDVEITKVNVSVGDSVKAGDVLMKLDTSDIKQNLSEAKESLDKSKKRNELSVSDAKRNVSEVEQTQNFQVQSAKKARDNAWADYIEAEKNYSNAKQKLERLKTKKDEAKNKLTEAKGNSNPEDAARIAELETKYNTALTEWKQQKELVSTYKQQRKTAKTTYENQKDSYEQALLSQKSSVAAAKSNQETAKLSQDTSTQESQIRQYQKQYENGTITAPFDGIVTAVNYEKGETYTVGTTLVTVQDCSRYEIEAKIGEYDISSVEVGQQVVIKTDATGDEEMTGEVKEVSPVSTSSEGNASLTASEGITGSDVNYKVRISIEDPSDRLRLDMSANLSIIIERHVSALTVPYNAVKTDENGNAYVVVEKEDGTTENVEVSVVMESNYYTEIKSEKLKEGTKVAIEKENESSNPFENMQQRGGGF